MVRQDTSMMRSETSAPHKAGKKAKRAAGYTGAPTDTALHAKPGTQTGRARGDTSRATEKFDTMTAPTGRVSKKGKKGYQYTGPPSDTALKAKPGVQTGEPDTGKAQMRRRPGAADTMKDTTRSP